ncbi:MAG: ABC transporter permease subunit [Magnetococcales bacterium]|nr:ABC transporter permease subunit [Magnetococcales bacterium]
MIGLDFSSALAAWPLLLEGAIVTARITLTAMLVGLVWGTVLAVARLSPVRPLAWLATLYINLFRSVPLVMVILWFFLIVPEVLHGLFGRAVGDIRLASAMVAFALFEAAYYAEILRAGILSVPHGQMEAGLALGFTRGATLRSIILPQAFRNMLPLLLTQAVILFQDTSLVYVIGLADFFGMSYKIGDRDGRLTEMLIMAGAVYLCIGLLFSRLVARLQKRFSK